MSCAPLVVVFHRVHWVAGGRLLWLVLSSCGVFHAFCPLSCFACGALHLNMALFRVLRAFLAGFMVRMWFVWVWGFALIVWLLCACMVRRLYGLWRVRLYFFLFSSSSPIFWGIAFVVLGLSSWLLGFCSWSCHLSLCGLLLFLFPLRYIRKKKGRNSLRPLLSCCVLFVSLVHCALLRASGYSRLCMPLYLP